MNTNVFLYTLVQHNIIFLICHLAAALAEMPISSITTAAEIEGLARTTQKKKSLTYFQD